MEDTTFHERLLLFFRERIPLFPLAIQSLFISIGLGLSWSLLESSSLLILKKPLIVIFLGSFSLSLLLRVIDEIKDKETDKILFPERCLPRGAVFYSDVKALGWFSVLFFMILNLFLGKVYIPLFLLLLYFFLFTKWFFLPEKWRGNLVIVLLTHNPLGFFVALYFISFISYEVGKGILTFNHYLLCLGFWLPTLAWEVSRKIKAPEEENDYKTYSKKFGIVPALLLSMTALGLQFFIFVSLFGDVFKETAWFILMAFLYSFYLLLGGIFWFRPSPQLSKWLRPGTEFYFFMVNVILFLFGGVILYNQGLLY